MNIFEIPDLCRQIASHLPPIDVLLLVRARIFGPEYRFSIRELVLRRSSELGVPEPRAISLLEYLRPSNSMISGSFMLCTLISPQSGPLLWTPGDVDIYSKITKSTICAHCNHWLQYHSEITEWFCAAGMRTVGVRDYTYIDRCVVNSRKWIQAEAGDPIKMNELIVDGNVSTVTDFVSQTFDFDFCKITYDGNTLWVADTHSVQLKKCAYYGNAALNDHLRGRLYQINDTYTRRKQKYQQRGFEIYCDYTM